MNLLLGLGMLVLLGLMIRGFARFSWRESEREYHEYRSRRGEDEDPDRFDGRGGPGSYWGGWGRPG